MKKKILLVEDDSFLSSLAARALDEAGYEVELATDAEKAMEYLSKGTPDLILLDLVLPGMNGFEFLEKIKKEEKTKSIPVVILSNLGSKEEIEQGFRLGAHSYLIKSHILLDDLVKRIDEVI